MNYQQVSEFGASFNNSNPVFNNDPLTMCIGNDPAQRFNHGGNTDSYGQDSEPCQTYLAQRCAKNWDVACEIASVQPDGGAVATMSDGYLMKLTSGDLMLRNTAMEKYRVSIRTANNATQQCQIKSEPFNTLIPASPIMTRYIGDCIGEYAVDPSVIDSDPVMNKILRRPNAFIPLLNNIRDTMMRMGTFMKLTGTRLGNYYGLSSAPIVVPIVVPEYAYSRRMYVAPPRYVSPYVARMRFSPPRRDEIRIPHHSRTQHHARGPRRYSVAKNKQE